MGELIDLNPPAEISDSITRDTELASAIANHAALSDPHPSLWTRIFNGFLRLTGGQQVFKNNPPLSNASFFASESHMELATSNGSNPIIGFHRGGRTAVALYHGGAGNDELRIRNNVGYDSPLLHDENHTLNTKVHGLRTAFFSMNTPTAVNSITTLSLGAIPLAKISHIAGIITNTSGTNVSLTPDGGGGVAGTAYYLSASNGLLTCSTTADSASVLNKPVRVTVWYQP
jgi:hypothetical protein